MAIIALGNSTTPVRLPYVYRVGERRLLFFTLDNHVDALETVDSVAYAVTGSRLTLGESFGPITITDTINGKTYTKAYAVLVTAVSAGVDVVTAIATIDNPNIVVHRETKAPVQIEITT